MSWFDVDDKIADSPGVQMIPKRYRTSAMGVWMLCGAWLSSHLNPYKFVPTNIVRLNGGTGTLTGELIKAGFWLPVDNGVEFTEQGCRIRTPERVQHERGLNAERVRKYRGKQPNSPDQGVPDNVTPLHGIRSIPLFTPLTPPPAASCPRHPNGTHRGCRGCDAASAVLSDWEYQRMVCCLLCDEKGWAYGPDGSVHPGSPKCTHPFGPGDLTT